MRKQEGCLFLPAFGVCVLQLQVTSSEFQAEVIVDRCRFAILRIRAVAILRTAIRLEAENPVIAVRSEEDLPALKRGPISNFASSGDPSLHEADPSPLFGYGNT